ncbi:MAG: apolipoprotein N-acyltransferase [Rhodothalassiaceae bacterium]
MDRLRRALAAPAPARWAAALLLGAVAAFAFAPFYWVPLFFLGLSGLLLLIERAPAPRAAAALGWWFGLGHFAVGLHWIAESYRNNPDWPDAMGPPTVLLLAMGMALYPALATAVTRAVEGPRAMRLVVLATAWAAAEWLRGHLLTGFPWNPAAAIWAGQPVMMQPLAHLGPWGYGLLTVLIAASPALLLPRPERRHDFLWPAAAAIALAAIAGYGVLRLGENPTLPDEDVTVRLVQANIPQLEKWDPARRRAHFADYLALSAMQGPVEGRLHVVWPETAVTDYAFDQHPGRRALAARILPAAGFLVTGAPRAFRTAEGNIGVANSLFVINASGRIMASYDKAKLVPFAEFVPTRGLIQTLGLDRVLPLGGDFAAGPGPVTLSLPGLPPFRPLICYEIIFPDVVRAPPRPAFLLNITNDAWFGTTTGPYQHLAQARMRAVEEGVAIVRVANTGISAVIDPVGRITARIPLATRGVVDAPLPRPLLGGGLYASLGDRVFMLLLISCASFTILMRKS